MRTYQFATGTDFRWEGDRWRVHCSLPDNRVIAEKLTTRAVEAFDLKMLQSQVIAGRIQFDLEVEPQLSAKSDRLVIGGYYQPGLFDDPPMLLDQVEMVRARLDLLVYDGIDNLVLGRPTLTVSRDRATGYPHGMYLGYEHPSYLTDLECLYHGICPKPDTKERYGTKHDWLLYGIPGTLVTDNGRDFISTHLADACKQLGITLVQMPGRTPNLGGQIERFIRTISDGIVSKLPGTTYLKPIRQVGYDGGSHDCISVQDLDKILHTYLLDVYAENKHPGLQGIPARRLEDELARGFVPALPAGDELGVVLGRVAERTIRHHGIELEGLTFNCSELHAIRVNLNGEKARIKYHPGDLSHIYVWNPSLECYVEVPAVAHEYAQELSLWKHRVIRNYALERMGKVDCVALGEAKRRIQQDVDDARHRGRRISQKQRWMSCIR